MTLSLVKPFWTHFSISHSQMEAQVFILRRYNIDTLPTRTLNNTHMPWKRHDEHVKYLEVQTMYYKLLVEWTPTVMTSGCRTSRNSISPSDLGLPVLAATMYLLIDETEASYAASCLRYKKRCDPLTTHQIPFFYCSVAGSKPLWYLMKQLIRD